MVEVKMNNNSRLILLTFIFFSQTLLANNFSGQRRKGIEINPTSPSLLSNPHSVGDTVRFQGDICGVKSRFANQGFKCEKLNFNQLSVKAYYPDEATEVTDQVNFAVSNNNKKMEYDFVSPALTSENPGQFTLVVGKANSSTDYLLKVKAKLQKRLDFILARIIAVESSNIKWKEWRLSFLNRFKDRLTSIISRIDNGLQENPDILSRLSIPVQVENSISKPMSYSTMYSGFRINMDLPKGIQIEGADTPAIIEVTNLNHKKLWFPNFFNESNSGDNSNIDDELEASIKLSGQTLEEISLEGLQFGEKKRLSYDLSFADAGSAQKLEVNLYKKKRFFFFSWKLFWGKAELDFIKLEDDSAPTLANILPEASKYYFNSAPSFSGEVVDSFGLLKESSFSATLDSTPFGGIQSSLDISDSALLVDADFKRQYNYSLQTSGLVEGVHTLNFSMDDLAGNKSNIVSREFVFDTSAPVISISNPGNELTNNPIYNLSVTITDHSPTDVSILHNGNLIYESTDPAIDLPVTLIEGINNFEVRAFDKAGNIAQVKRVDNIELDTIAPVLSDFIPEAGLFIPTLSFGVGFKSNEALQVARVNGLDISLDTAKKVASGNTSYAIEGVHNLNYEAVDLAGNVTSVDVSIEIILKLLREELISINSLAGNKLEIRGGVGASRPGVEISINGGFGNSDTLNSNPDGSFTSVLNLFSSVILFAEDPALNREETITLSYAVDTSLSGVIRDKDNLPLPGVTVRIDSSGQSAISDAFGAFSISGPSLGNQRITIDPSTMDPQVVGPNKEFFETKINYNIGATQQNILDRPIYLCPLLKDGSETLIEDENTAVTVTSPHAPGVEIDIPAGSATFPDGGKVGAINIVEISKDVTAVPPVEYAVPDTVYTLEPSGLVFEEKVKLTLPNVNEFPPEMEMIILSKNSETGYWDVDGLAKVTSDGQRIETNDGEGISHFSEVYAAPYAPSVREYSAKDKAGADSFSGILSTSVSLPSYKVLGQDVAPGLVYKSTWANPNTIVSNLFHVPDTVGFLPLGSQGAGKFGFKARASAAAYVWTVPEYVDAQFFSEDLVSDKLRFTGLSPKSVVSYAMDLSSLENGIHPYNSRYELKLRQMIMTVTTRSEKKPFGRRETFSTVAYSSRLIDQVFNSSVVGTIPVENKIDSPVGRGWDIAGVQKILNPSSSQIMLDEGNGSYSVYGLDNTIETLWSNPHDRLRGVDFNWPNATFSDRRDIFNLDLTSGNEISEGTIKPFVGEDWNYSSTGIHGGTVNRWFHYVSPYVRRRDPGGIIQLQDGRYIGTGTYGSFFDLKSDGTSSALYPDGLLPGQLVRNRCAPTSHVSQAILSIECGSRPAPFSVYDRQGGPGIGPDVYYNQIPSEWPANGSGTGSLSDTRFNTPQGITHKFGSPNVVLVADSGNNRIIEVDLNTNTSTVFAGNGNNYDNGDGGLAINAGIEMPRQMAYDDIGNLYVSTAGGYIRKIGPNGFISTIAGNPSGQVTNDADALDMYIVNPLGLVVDNDNDYLYFSDSGQHRIVRLDLTNGRAATVAGNFQCIPQGNFGEGGSALNASICTPEYLGLDEDNNLLIADTQLNKILRVNFNSNENGRLAFSPTNKDNSRLFREADGSFTRTFRNGSSISYNSDGQQVESLDRTGRSVTYEYTNGNLTKMTDPLGGEVIYNYSGNKLSSIVDPAGRQTNLIFDGDNLDTVTFSDNTTRKFSYDSDGLMTSEINQRNLTTTYEFGPYKRLSKVIRPDLTNVEIFNGTSETIGNSFTGGASGAAKGQDGAELVDGIKDAKGNITEFRKDLNGYVNTITDADGRVTTVERDLDGRPTKITRPDTTTVDFTYDQNSYDLLSKVDSGTGVTISQTYDSFGNLLTQTDPRGNSSSNVYDINTGLLLTQTNQLNQTTTNDYYALGVLKTRTNNLNQTVTFEYDSFGNLSKQTDPEGNETLFTRDAAGNVTKVKNANGQETVNTYDAFNRLTSVLTPKGELTRYEYLPTGELSKIIDPLNNTTLFEYDVLGRLTKKTDSLGKITQLSYDDNGNVTEEIDPNGNTKTFEYDNLDQLTKRILPDNTYEFSYDVRGNVTQIKNGFSQIDFIYERNEAGDLVDAVQTQGLGAHSDLPVFEVEYDYDVSGNRTSMQTDIGNFTYTYDTGNRLTGITNHKSESFGFSYDTGNRLTGVSRPGSDTAFNFDDTNFLTSIIHQKTSGTNINTFSYTKDLIGNRKTASSSAGIANYDYDDNNQLTQGTNPESLTENFTYDSNGNRLTDDFGSYNYDANSQRLTEDYRYLYFYDENGNLSSKNSKTDSKVINYVHNSENQLVGIDYFDGATPTKEITYVYDALGRRVKKQVTDLVTPANSFTRKYVYDGNEILAEFDIDNKLLATYTHSTLRTDDVLAVDVTTDGVAKGTAQAAQSYFYIKDGQGTIVDIVDSAGSKVQHHVYSAFGELVNILDPLGNVVTAAPPLAPYFGFTGREHDKESGLTYFRARYLDNSIGRFIQVDPVSGETGSPLTVHSKYIYSLNDPINRIDPTGNFSLKKAFGTVIASTFGAINSAFAQATTGVFSKNFDFSESNVRLLNTAAIATAGFAAGAGAGAVIAGTFLAGGVTGFAASIISGAVVGGITGGITGGSLSVLSGGSFSTGFARGAIIGLIAGAIGGGFGFGFTDPTKGAPKITDLTREVTTVTKGKCLIGGGLAVLGAAEVLTALFTFSNPVTGGAALALGALKFAAGTGAGIGIGVSTASCMGY